MHRTTRIIKLILTRQTILLRAVYRTMRIRCTRTVIIHVTTRPTLDIIRGRRVLMLMRITRIEDARRHRAALAVLLRTQIRMMLSTVLAHPKRLITHTVKHLFVIPRCSFLMTTRQLLDLLLCPLTTAKTIPYLVITRTRRDTLCVRYRATTRAGFMTFAEIQHFLCCCKGFFRSV